MRHLAVIMVLAGFVLLAIIDLLAGRFHDGSIALLLGVVNCLIFLR